MGKILTNLKDICAPVPNFAKAKVIIRGPIGEFIQEIPYREFSKKCIDEKNLSDPVTLIQWGELRQFLWHDDEFKWDSYNVDLKLIDLYDVDPSLDWY